MFKRRWPIWGDSKVALGEAWGMAMMVSTRLALKSSMDGTGRIGFSLSSRRH
jgi:hypothetical protein